MTIKDRLDKFVRDEYEWLRGEISTNIAKGKDYLTKDFYDYVVETYKVKKYSRLAKIDYSLAQKASKMGWDVNLIKEERKRGYSLEEVKEFMQTNNIQEYKDFIKYTKGQSVRKYYNKYVSKGLLEDTATKSKPGNKEGFKYSEEARKKLSESKKKAWADPNKYQSRNRSNNFTLNTK